MYKPCNPRTCISHPDRIYDDLVGNSLGSIAYSVLCLNRLLASRIGDDPEVQEHLLNISLLSLRIEKAKRDHNMSNKGLPLNKDIFRSLIQTTLTPYKLWSPEAEELLMGTCAQESGFGQYRHQIGGPAHGIMQVESATFEWLQTHFGKANPEITQFHFEQLISDDRASIIMARLKYRSVPFHLPAATDLKAQAHYWNMYYNCNPRYGTDEEYIQHYLEYVGGPAHL